MKKGIKISRGICLDPFIDEVVKKLAVYDCTSVSAILERLVRREWSKRRIIVEKEIASGIENTERTSRGS